MAQPPKEKQEEPRRNWSAAVGSDLQRAAGAVFARAGFSDPALVLHWTEIAGAEVARLARPLRFSEKDGTLTLLAEPAAALFLGHESRTLAARINEWAGRSAVTRVKFVQGRLSQPTPLPAPPKPKSVPRPGDPALAYRGPDALKAALQSLARWRAGHEDREG
jgi:hypothetical protein